MTCWSTVAVSTIWNVFAPVPQLKAGPDRKSTRLNSSHLGISYAVFLLDLFSFPPRRSSDLVALLVADGRARDRVAELRGAPQLVDLAADEVSVLVVGADDVLVDSRGVDDLERVRPGAAAEGGPRSEEHTSELQSLRHLVCRLPPRSLLVPSTTLFRSCRSACSRRPCP